VHFANYQNVERILHSGTRLRLLNNVSTEARHHCNEWAALYLFAYLRHISKIAYAAKRHASAINLQDGFAYVSAVRLELQNKLAESGSQAKQQLQVSHAVTALSRASYR